MPKVIVVGDLILDIYHYGHPLKDSVEGLLAIGEDKTEASFGGAGLLVRNIVQLGGRVDFVTVIGNDEFGDLAQKFIRQNLKKTFFVENGRKTTVKERFVVNGKKVLKWNHLDNRPLNPAIQNRILLYLAKNIRGYDKLIISDYRHGLISQSFARALVALGKKFKKPVYVDSQIAQSKGNHAWYKGADLMCLNELEAKSIKDEIDIPNIILKLGSKGSLAVIEGKKIRTPAFKVKVVDTTGAGDAFFAALVISNFPPTTSDLKRANKWAALTTTKMGTELPKTR